MRYRFQSNFTSLDYRLPVQLSASGFSAMLKEWLPRKFRSSPTCAWLSLSLFVSATILCRHPREVRVGGEGSCHQHRRPPEGWRRD